MVAISRAVDGATGKRDPDRESPKNVKGNIMAAETRDREIASTPAPRSPAQERAAQQWQRLWGAILTITPRGIARFVLLVGGVYTLIWLVRASWPASLPFVAGGAIAYIMLPV